MYLDIFGFSTGYKKLGFLKLIRRMYQRITLDRVHHQQEEPDHLHTAMCFSVHCSSILPSICTSCFILSGNLQDLFPIKWEKDNCPIVSLCSWEMVQIYLLNSYKFLLLHMHNSILLYVLLYSLTLYYIVDGSQQVSNWGCIKRFFSGRQISNAFRGSLSFYIEVFILLPVHERPFVNSLCSIYISLSIVFRIIRPYTDSSISVWIIF